MRTRQLRRLAKSLENSQSKRRDHGRYLTDSDSVLIEIHDVRRVQQHDIIRSVTEQKLTAEVDVVCQIPGINFNDSSHSKAVPMRGVAAPI